MVKAPNRRDYIRIDRPHGVHPHGNSARDQKCQSGSLEVKWGYILIDCTASQNMGIIQNADVEELLSSSSLLGKSESRQSTVGSPSNVYQHAAGSVRWPLVCSRSWAAWNNLLVEHKNPSRWNKMFRALRRPLLLPNILQDRAGLSNGTVSRSPLPI